MTEKLNLASMDPKGRRVLMRVDFNVPIDSDRMISDDTRIRAALPSIEHVVSGGGRLVLMSHLGRPKGAADDRSKFSLAPVAAAPAATPQISRPIVLGTLARSDR